VSTLSTPSVGTRLRVTVPATSANLGPGFDALALALGLADDVVAEVRGPAEPALTVEVTGEAAQEVPRDATHLIVRVLDRAAAHAGAARPPLRLRCTNRIPHGRGLGSSAAATVAGLLLARGLLAPDLDDDAVLALATEVEGHPDNVAACLLGGLAIAWSGEGGVRAVRSEVAPDVRAAVLVPPDALPTERARGMLPSTVPHPDAAFTAGRAALLVEALTRRSDLLLPATEDRLHQDYRAAAMPESARLIRALRAQGVAAVVSGAGPSVLVLAGGPVPDLTRWLPPGWRAVDAVVGDSGAQVVREA